MGLFTWATETMTFYQNGLYGYQWECPREKQILSLSEWTLKQVTLKRGPHYKCIRLVCCFQIVNEKIGSCLQYKPASNETVGVFVRKDVEVWQAIVLIAVLGFAGGFIVLIHRIIRYVFGNCVLLHANVIFPKCLRFLEIKWFGQNRQITLPRFLHWNYYLLTFLFLMYLKEIISDDSNPDVSLVWNKKCWN